MRITDLLDARSILLDASPKSKSEALDQIVDLMVKSEKINDKEAYRKQVYAREEESTTGIGEGIAIPHGKCDAVTKPGLPHTLHCSFPAPEMDESQITVPDCEEFQTT